MQRIAYDSSGPIIHIARIFIGTQYIARSVFIYPGITFNLPGIGIIRIRILILYYRITRCIFISPCKTRPSPFCIVAKIVIIINLCSIT